MEECINLRETTNKLINLEKAVDRLEKSTKLLNDLEIPFERFNALEHQQGLIGCGLSHLNLLETITPRTTIFEDDIGYMPNADTEIIVPQGTDAVYLGVSNHGYIRTQSYGYRGVVLASQHTPHFKRIFNMCSTHAILYLSDRYIKAARDVVLDYLKKSLPFDVGLASIHKDFTILTPNDPIFYQTEQPEFTKFSLQV